MKTEDFINFDEGFDHLADLLAGGESSIELSTFDDFVQTVFSKSYPEYDFSSWHIRKLSAWVDEVLASENKLGTAALPRYHLKSTICVSPDTEIRTEDGYKNVFQVKVGDKVRTHLGNYKAVAKFYERPYQGKIFVLNLKNGERIKITGEHPVLTKRGWVEAKNLTLRDVLHADPMCNSMRILKIEKEDYDGKVYNLEVEDDHSYAGKGIIFHNCGYALTIYRMLKSYGDGLYVSYKEELATFHLSNIKQAIARNDILAPIFKDMKTQSDSMINYRIGDKKIVRMFSSGIFSMKRGLHANVGVIVDDILGTVDNPMVLTELEKAERMFNQEVINIPNPGCPLIVFGTAIDYSDLLFKLKENPEFKSIWLPAIDPIPDDPDPDHKVLWGSRFSKDWLDTRKRSSGWKSFSSEFLLMPVLSADAFFTRNDLDKVIDKDLKNYSIFQSFKKEDKHVVAGLDIGRRRNPSHLSVFVDDNNENLIQIHQSFWDGLEYTEQIDRIKTVIENFQIDKLYIDATRSEMEERGLPRQCIMIKFTGKGERSQASFANDFATRVENGKIRLMDDDRFISQILCMTNNLKAPVTAAGHADSFWSVALAIGAYQDFYSSERKQRFSYLGNMQEQFIEHSPIENKNIAGICPVCQKKKLIKVENGQQCENCGTFFIGGVNERPKIVQGQPKGEFIPKA